MSILRVIILISLAAGWQVSAQTWDSSGNSMLSGTYYFRETAFAPYDYYGDMQDGIALYGNITFDGNGNYTLSGSGYDAMQGTATIPAGTKGTYVISASGYGYISSYLGSGALIYGTVSKQGIFIGSSTESYYDLFIAAPAAPQATTATFKGSYTMADMDFEDIGYTTSTAYYTLCSMFQMNPDGAGNSGSLNLTGYVAEGGSTQLTQSVASVKYSLQNGAVILPLPTPSNANLIAGTKWLYITPDGNFAFGGSPTGFDMLVGVRTGSATPSFSGLFYQAGMDEDASTLASGYATVDTYYGALSALGGPVVGHQRIQYNSATDSGIYDYGYTYSDTFTPSSSGTYSNSVMNYAVSADGTMRVGSGIGPYLGINVALLSPNVTTGSGVYIYPQYVLNAASYAPFTAGVSAGEVITLAGQNLANKAQSATTLPFPNTLANNVQVTVNGLPAPLISVSQTSVSFLVPYAVGSSSLASIQVSVGGTLSNTVTLPVNMTTPGLFTFQQNGIGDAAALHADYTFVNSSSPAQPGETIQLFLTGLGAVYPMVQDGAVGPSSTFSLATNTITAFINGESATVGYQGLAPGEGGLYQLNVTVPSDLTSGTYYMDVAGPDSYASEATIAVGTPTSTSAVVGRAQPMIERPRSGRPRRPAKIGSMFTSPASR
jgi:uncharacterized protein (TIGR03437 family)